MKKYEPESGQMLFGCPAGEFDCPDYIEAQLAYLARDIERVEGNRTQKDFEAPTGNNGGEYHTDVFTMNAYYWGDCDCGKFHEAGCPVVRPNFKCGDFEVRWYKYLGRGMSLNQKISANKAVVIFDKCLKSVRERDINLGEEE